LKALIITIGDEILIGQTIDTNSAWIGNKLNEIGIEIDQILSVRDREDAIIEALEFAINKRFPLVILTGGLGPTKDDITKKVLCKFFDTSLEMNAEILLKIESYFKARGRDILDTNRQQAALPKNCVILPNNLGTASGMLFEKDNSMVVSMPGVPYEMKGIFEEQLIPHLKSNFDLPAIYHKTIMFEGIGESFLAEKIKDWEESLNAEAIKIAYLPSPGVVKVRLTAMGNKMESLQEKVNRKAKELSALMPKFIFGEDDIKLEETISEILNNSGKTISTAESCTGGYIAHLLTSVAGSSNYFKGSIVSYANEVKENQLGVSSSDLENFGAVSKEVVEQMATGVRSRLKTDYAISTSGVAGPTGGTEVKPVGFVWIAIASKHQVISKKFQFEKDRARNIRRTAMSALNMLRREVENELSLSKA